MSDTQNSSSDADLQKLKVADLKKQLKDRGLSVTGNKPDLIARLQGQETGLRGTSEEETNDELLGDDFDDDVDTSVLNDVNEAQLLSPAEKLAPSESNKSAAPAAPTSPTAAAAAPTAAAAAVTAGKPLITKVTAPGVPAGGAIASADKMSERLKRFGVVSQEAKKLSRVERFGSAVTTTVTPVTAGAEAVVKSKPSGVLSQSAEIVAEKEKLRKRSERFGLPAEASTAAAATVGASSKTLSNNPVADVSTLKKRAERFGQQTSSVLTKATEQERLTKRKSRFGTVLSSTSATSGGAAVVDEGAVEAKKLKRAERFGLAVA